MKIFTKDKLEYVQICPNCKSPDVNIDKSNPLQPAMGMPAYYICNKCNHLGYNFPQIKIDELESFEKEIAKKHLSNKKKDESSLVDQAYGNFQVRVMWKFFAPFIIIGGILMLFRLEWIGIIVLLIGIFMLYITYIKKNNIIQE